MIASGWPAPRVPVVLIWDKSSLTDATDAHDRIAALAAAFVVPLWQQFHVDHRKLFLRIVNRNVLLKTCVD
jgi:hypothetical protein